MVDIRRLLKRYEAGTVAILDSDSRVGVVFTMQGRRVRFVMQLPPVSDFSHNSAGAKMGKRQQQQAHEKVIRQHWRALLLTINAKLESFEIGIETFEEAFMAQLVLADGKTFGETVLQQIENGSLPLLSGEAQGHD